ncbi:hypothetical protein COCON_G00086720 [Conger conger]|uniref:Glutathione peroxidase n=2 Tax=Conger conger TaxID=82655 RepID=A0A9Q1DK65_CONCO|nr:hypothetical protein COCON_G00086720 [Conger conger]
MWVVKRAFGFGILGSRAFVSAMAAQAEDWRSAKSIYEFSAKDIDGNEVSLETYRGHVCIITNLASK